MTLVIGHVKILSADFAVASRNSAEYLNSKSSILLKIDITCKEKQIFPQKFVIYNETGVDDSLTVA